MIQCTGSSPNTDYMKENLSEFLDARGNIKVNQYFQITTEDPQLILARDEKYMKEDKDGLGGMIIGKINQNSED